MENAIGLMPGFIVLLSSLLDCLSVCRSETAKPLFTAENAERACPAVSGIAEKKWSIFAFSACSAVRFSLSDRLRGYNGLAQIAGEEGANATA
jgi:hypothetical protein